MAGRKPTPTTLKVIKGNPGKRALNKKEPQPNRVIPSCPEHLDDAAKVAWGKLVVLLDRIGVLTEADTMALERMCSVYAEILDCQDLIERDGRTYTTEDQLGNTLIKNNPAVNQLRAADMLFKSYLAEFGMTPSARSRVQVQGNDDKDKKDPLQEFFG